MRRGSILLTVQGLYFVATGLWPLVSLRTFELVTGPKTDDWLVMTVGALAAVIGAALLASARALEPEWPTVVLGAGSALAFLLVDLVFVADGVIPPVYLADAVVEAVFLIGWLMLLLRRSPRRGE